MASCTREENVRDASAMAQMYAALDRLPVPMVGRVHGGAFGGGAGLVAVCDVVVAEERALFGFTEVKLGILPATIAPYVMTKIGASAARELFLTGMRFDAARAKEIGLVHAVVAADRLDERVHEYVQELLSAAPRSHRGGQGADPAGVGPAGGRDDGPDRRRDRLAQGHTGRPGGHTGVPGKTEGHVERRPLIQATVVLRAHLPTPNSPAPNLGVGLLGVGVLGAGRCSSRVAREDECSVES